MVPAWREIRRPLVSNAPLLEKLMDPPTALAHMDGIGALKISTVPMLAMDNWSICTLRSVPLDAAEATGLPSIVTVDSVGSKPRTRGVWGSFWE